VRGGGQTPQIVTVNEKAPALRHPKTNELVERRRWTMRTEDPGRRGQARRVGGLDRVTGQPLVRQELVNRVWGYDFGRGIVGR